MITIITEKPSRSIDIIGHGVDSYTDKNGKEIWRVFGIVAAGSRGRVVTRDSGYVKDLYIDDTTIVIYRDEDKHKAMLCKDYIDRHIAHGAPVFGVEAFKQFINGNKGDTVDAEAVSENVN